ncbi:MAG TPA: universal stress protein, partial [Hanamia sp.]|nr:universal stress protein [Hanamia sp.]
IDFSDTSLNAARYAVQLTSVIPDARIILYHVYSKISFATLTSKEEGSRQQVTESELEEIKNKIAVAGTENISYLAEEGSFVDNIKDYVLGNHIDMVIM